MNARFLMTVEVCIVLLLPAPIFSQSGKYFTDIAEESGIVYPHVAAADCWTPVATGSAWADVDNDSDLDLYLTNYGGPNRFYLNQSAGFPSFVEAAESYGIDLPDLLSNGVVFADYDNDGDQDLYVLSLHGNNLFQNQLIESGSLGFIDVTATAGVGDEGRAVTASWGDFDQDGFLDLYLAKHKKCIEDPDNVDRLFHNNGDGTFEDVSRWLCGGNPTCIQLEKGLGFTAGWVDYDNDGDPDLYLANDMITGWYTNTLWRNDGGDGNGWVFTDVSEESGAGIGINSMGLGVADYNNDGWFDFALSNIGFKKLLRSSGDGTFEEVSVEAGVEEPGGITWGTVFFDYDNDGWEDLYFTNGLLYPHFKDTPNILHRNNQDGTFSTVSQESGLDDSSFGRGASIVDINGDGFVDVLVANLFDFPLLFLNRMPELGETNHWLTITVEGSVSNRDGIGTRLTLVTADSLSRMREITTGPTHGGGDYRAGFFGLGDNDRGYLSVRWPRGIIQEIGSVQADQYLHLVEPWPVSVNAEIDGMFDPLPDSGGTFMVSTSVTNHSAERYQGDLWLAVRRPDGSLKNPYRGPRRISLQPGSATEKRGNVTIPGSAPAGEYWFISYVGEYPESFVAVDSVWISKSPPSDVGVTAAEGRNQAGDQFLTGNYPNPFNPTTEIRFLMSEVGHVTLTIYDILGREIATLVNEKLTPGMYTRQWDATGYPSGVYFYRLETSGIASTRKLILTR